MAESFDAYRERVLGYLGNLDPIEVQQTTAAALEALVGGVNPEILMLRIEPDKWSIVEILAHLVDAELAMAWRIRNMLATPGIALPWFDQDKWADVFEYQKRDPLRSIEIFRHLRESNLTILQSIPRSQWGECYGIHQVRGRQTVAEFVALEAAHDLNHIRQIEKILSAAGLS